MICVAAEWDNGAYPRERGGNDLGRPNQQPCGGLSPRTRGKRHWRLPDPAWKGPIPANAGETPSPPPICSASGAYPRERGGNAVTYQLCPTPRGLSPRTRGKPLPTSATNASSGPIPANAGETLFKEFQQLAGNGLSPRTRGKPLAQSGQNTVVGPIPANAGETPFGQKISEVFGAYPRERGGNRHVNSKFLTFKGLSPRTRGKRRHAHPRTGLSGPIPANAGET